MIASLAVTAAIYAAVLALLCGGQALRRTAPGPVMHAAVILLEAAFTAVAAGETVRWVTGERIPQPAVHGAYLLTSVAIMPLIAGRTPVRQPGGAPPRPGDAAVLAVALIAAAIVELRLLATGA